MGTLNSNATLNFDKTQCKPMGGQTTNQVYLINSPYTSPPDPPILKSRDISSTGNTEHFIGANSATTKNSIKSTTPIDTSKILTRGYNQLYNQIFCNLFNLPQNFNTCKDCNYTYDTSSTGSSSDGYATNTTYPLKYVKDPVSLTDDQKAASSAYITSVGSGPLCSEGYTFDNSTGNSRCIPTSSSALGQSGCQTLCYNDPYCSSYNYNGNNSECILNNAVPNQIMKTPDSGINSGYSIDYNYDYTSLSNGQQNNVQMRCANQYLNNTFMASKYQDLSSCITIRDGSSSYSDSDMSSKLLGISTDGKSTMFDVDPKCFYDKLISDSSYKPNIVDNSIYIENPNLPNAGKSKSDPNIDSYKKEFDEYNRKLKMARSKDSPSVQNISNSNKLKGSYIDSITDKTNTIASNQNNIYRDLDGKIIQTVDHRENKKNMHIEHFDNKLSTYQIISIVLIIIILINIIFFIFKKK